MIKTINKVLKLGINIAKVTKKEAEKEVKKIVDANIITKKDGKALVKTLLKEAKSEKKKLEKIIKKEAKKASPVLSQSKSSAINLAKKIGAETILVYSGKTSPPVDSKYSMHIDHEANNLSDVIKILNEIG